MSAYELHVPTGKSAVWKSRCCGGICGDSLSLPDCSAAYCTNCLLYKAGLGELTGNCVALLPLPGPAPCFWPLLKYLALLWGIRKLRAKPGATSTNEPAGPKSSTSCIRHADPQEAASRTFRLTHSPDDAPVSARPSVATLQSCNNPCMLLGATAGLQSCVGFRAFTPHVLATLVREPGTPLHNLQAAFDSSIRWM